MLLLDINGFLYKMDKYQVFEGKCLLKIIMCYKCSVVFAKWVTYLCLASNSNSHCIIAYPISDIIFIIIL